ncbi:hypothetical protein Tco_1312336 [Tanacetum coccineum]
MIGNNHPTSIRKSHVAGGADVEEENMNTIQTSIVTTMVSMVSMPKIVDQQREQKKTPICYHMSRQRSLFTELKETFQGHVSFGDASKIEVKGHGNIRFLYAGKERSIEDVY